MAITMDKFNVQVKISAQQTNDSEMEKTSNQLNEIWSWVFSDAAGVNAANKIDRFWSDRRTLAATTAEDLDLAGALTHVFGDTIAAARVKFIAARHRTTGASAALQIGGHATLALLIFGATPDLDTAQPFLIVPPGGGNIYVAPDLDGIVVNAGAEDMLRIYNGAAAAVDYDIVIGYSLT